MQKYEMWYNGLNFAMVKDSKSILVIASFTHHNFQTQVQLSLHSCIEVLNNAQECHFISFSYILIVSNRSLYIFYMSISVVWQWWPLVDVTIQCSCNCLYPNHLVWNTSFISFHICHFISVITFCQYVIGIMQRHVSLFKTDGQQTIGAQLFTNKLYV